ncbi:MAG: hypothetical protein AAFO02_18120 [Bacteroidota bacterium]
MKRTYLFDVFSCVKGLLQTKELSARKQDYSLKRYERAGSDIGVTIDSQSAIRIMKEIAGVSINELEDLDTNIQQLRQELSKRLDFWTTYEEIVSSYQQKRGLDSVGGFFKMMLFLSVLPSYIVHQLQAGKRNALIANAEQELIAFYDLPETKVRRFKLQCSEEKKQYKEKLDTIDQEIATQKTNLSKASIGVELKQEIEALLESYVRTRKRYQDKYDFYQQCEEKLSMIEEQVQVYHSLEASKQRLELLEQAEGYDQKKEDVKDELELYEYYSTLLVNLSDNLNKVRADQEEEIEELELKAILSKVKVLG